MNIDIEVLMRPFDGSQVRQRTGPGRKPLDYISGSDVMRRLLDATGNHFSWSVEKVQLIPLETPNGPSFLWLVLGTLTVGDLGSRSGVGTHPSDGVEAAKAAETDALKRAAVKFGVGLHLHEDDASQSTGSYNGNSPAPGQTASRGRAEDMPPADSRNNAQRPSRVGNGYATGANGSSNSQGYGNGNSSSGNGYAGSRRNNPPAYANGNNPSDGVGENAPF
ncbi:MAG: hypothetical protein EOO39_33275 [Cytophagaceae bacterium]|nr:MAG: hypothetical protein EOO39_33275 [Cytophagaceae bacterium]